MLKWKDIQEFGITEDLLERYNNLRLHRQDIDPRVDFCREIIYQCETKSKKLNAKKFLHDLCCTPEQVVKKLYFDYDRRHIDLSGDRYIFHMAAERGFPHNFDITVEDDQLVDEVFDYDAEIDSGVYHIQVDKFSGEIFITTNPNSGPGKCGVAIDLCKEFLFSKELYHKTLYNAVKTYYAGEFIYNGYRQWCI